MSRYFKINKTTYLLAIWQLLCIGMIIFSTSCKDPDQPQILLGSGYKLNGKLYNLGRVTSYRTDWGEILYINGGGFDFVFVLSDTTQSKYVITDTVFSSDIGKFRCTQQIQNSFFYATEGSLEYDRLNNKIQFEVNPNGLLYTNGILITDTILRTSIIDFSTITMRDQFGVMINQGDENDWSYRDKWKLAEAQLLNLENDYTNKGGRCMTVYPNPVQNSCVIDFIWPNGSNFNLVLVNPNMEVELAYKYLKDNDLNLLLDNPAFDGHYYRLYFQRINNEASLYGSGDLFFSQ